jgi:hypothetical protein
MNSTERSSVATRPVRAVGDVAERAVPAPGGTVAPQPSLDNVGALLAGNVNGPGVIP